MKITIVVESPAKCKTIQKYLNEIDNESHNQYRVIASGGHIRHFIKVDEKNGNFTPKYKPIPMKSKYIKQLKDTARDSDEIIIATDADREGHAIGWHIAKILNLNIKTTKRIIFHEITKDAIKQALQNPTTIDMNQVYSQQGRSVLDWLIGFKISPLLWKHIQDKLSAGRVQSVATRLIIDREKEIEEYNPTKTFKITAMFAKNISAKLSKTIKKKSKVITFLKNLNNASYTVQNIKKKQSSKTPPPPFITSTLQQSAGRTLKMSPKLVMSIAQKLYEKGYITYHRTDSTILSNQALTNIEKYIKNTYTEKYYNRRNYITSNDKKRTNIKTKKTPRAQEAHEAIRPTNVFTKSITHQQNTTPLESRLYRLIWNRTIASQMSNHIFDVYSIIIKISSYDIDKYHFISKYEITTFDGYTILYTYRNNLTIPTNVYPSVKINDIIDCKEISAKETLTQHPPRYSEHSLVSTMKKKGIGRPSTYASIIDKIQIREYVEKRSSDGDKKDITILRIYPSNQNDNTTITTTNSTIAINNTTPNIIEKVETILYGNDKNKLFPTETGKTTTQFLLEHFPNQMDYEYTSRVEEKLDEISNGNINWNTVIKEQYDNFIPTVKKLSKQVSQNKINANHVGKHPDTGEDIYIYVARYGLVIKIGGEHPAGQQNKNSIKRNENETNENKKTKTKTKTKGRYVSLPKKLKSKMMSLEYKDIAEYIKYPINLGQYKDIDVILCDGQYGKYIKYNGKNYSIKNCVSMSKTESNTNTSTNTNTNFEETLESAIALIDKSITTGQQSSTNIIKQFDTDTDNESITIRTGKYGPYICQIKLNNCKYKTKKPINTSIPKKYHNKLQELTLEECRTIISQKKTFPKRFFKFKKIK